MVKPWASTRFEHPLIAKAACLAWLTPPLNECQVTTRPSIGKFDRGFGLQEPKPRESLLTPSIRNRSPSSASRLSNTTIDTSGKTLVDSSSIKSDADSIGGNAEPFTPLVQRLASTTILERTPFAIDEAKDDDGGMDDLDSLDGVEGDVDQRVMDEVCFSSDENYHLGSARH